MNDVTSMLCVNLGRQLETLLFYIVTSRIEALVSHHKFLSACVEKVYRLLLQQIVYCRFLLCIWHRVSENADFQSQSGAQFSKTHSGKIRPDPWSWSVCFHGFSPQSAVRDGESWRWGDHCVCCRACYLNHFQISYTIVEPYCHSSLLLHRPHTLALECWLVGYLWPVEIGWLHGSHSRRDFAMRFAILQQLKLATATCYCD